MRQCGNEGRRAMRSGAPAVTPGVSAQAGNARPRFQYYRITALANCLIANQSFGCWKLPISGSADTVPA
jgi:hypothetical protein